MNNKAKGNRYLDRKTQKEHYEETRPQKTYNLNSTLNMFHGTPLEQAQEIIKNESFKIGSDEKKNSIDSSLKRCKKLESRRKSKTHLKLRHG